MFGVVNRLYQIALRDSGRARLGSTELAEVRPSRIALWLAGRLALPGSCKGI
jgi:hypothetical protein